MNISSNSAKIFQLSKGGGHIQAAGFYTEQCDINKIEKKLIDKLKDTINV